MIINNSAIFGKIIEVTVSPLAEERLKTSENPFRSVVASLVRNHIDNNVDAIGDCFIEERTSIIITKYSNYGCDVVSIVEPDTVHVFLMANSESGDIHRILSNSIHNRNTVINLGWLVISLNGIIVNIENTESDYMI